MSWAKSVLPMFTGDSSEKLRIAPDQVQIDTTHFRPQAPPKSALSRTRLAVNRTAVILDGKEIENYLLVPSALTHAVNDRLKERKAHESVSEKHVEDMLLRLADEMKSSVLS